MDNREAWLAVITDLTAEVKALREENAKLWAALETRSEDTARLDWLVSRVFLSPTGVSFDYARYVEDGQVLERGFRLMQRGFLGSRRKSLRQAIDAAMTESGR